MMKHLKHISDFDEISSLSDEDFHHISAVVPRYSHRLENSEDLDVLMDKIGDSRYVLLGEASHGTHEYYTWRMRITKRLIEEKGFSFVAV